MSNSSPSFDTSGVVLYSVAGGLYTVMAVVAAVRLIRRLRAVMAAQRTNDPSSMRAPLAAPDNAPQSAVPGGRALRTGILVLVTLVIYCVLRSTQLLLFAAQAVDTSGDFMTHFYTFFPALGFMSLQTALLIKWDDHVSQLTLALRRMRFRVGQFLIHCSVLFVAANSLVTATAYLDVRVCHFTSQPQRFWNILVNALCGVAYIFNGASFAGLGCFLRTLWAPTTVACEKASRRILAMALLFGVLCAARGIVLLLFLADGGTSSGAQTVQQVTHNDWGAPTVLIVEWCFLVVTLFLLTATTPSAASQLAGEEDEEDASGNTGSMTPPPPDNVGEDSSVQGLPSSTPVVSGGLVSQFYCTNSSSKSIVTPLWLSEREAGSTVPLFEPIATASPPGSLSASSAAAAHVPKRHTEAHRGSGQSPRPPNASKKYASDLQGTSVRAGSVLTSSLVGTPLTRNTPTQQSSIVSSALQHHNP